MAAEKGGGKMEESRRKNNNVASEISLFFTISIFNLEKKLEEGVAVSESKSRILVETEKELIRTLSSNAFACCADLVVVVLMWQRQCLFIGRERERAREIFNVGKFRVI